MFWLGIMLQWYLALELGLFPLGGRLGVFDDVPHQITGMITIDALLAGDPGTTVNGALAHGSTGRRFESPGAFGDHPRKQG